MISSLASLQDKPRYAFWKRVTDVVVSASLLVAASPVMAVAALAVKLTSPGPALFRQKRVGEFGEEFEILKFRSMYDKCSSAEHEEAIKRYMAGKKLNDEADSKSPYKVTNDPRITPVGRFIRKTSIDELPQLWNVLKGQMSMVGPRPPMPYEVANYSYRALGRLNGKPGLTGPWQVYGRNVVTFDEMVEMDIAYLGERSILYDLKLIALTAPAAIHSGE